MDYRNRIVAFVDAFNVDDLDQVMAFFADNAEYITLEGRHCRGKAAIRAEFQAQFGGRYGQLRFLRDQLIIDTQGRSAAVSWRCEHHLAGAPGSGPWRVAQALLARVAGPAPWWEGVDLFRFDGDRILGKYTYGRTRLPRFHRGR